MITTGGEGKVPPRKRLRGKIGDPSAAPELKTHNLLRNDNDTAETFYDMHKFHGIFSNSTSGIWYPLMGKWPVLGTSSHERIGKKIRVKFLRLKGYVAYSPFLITQVRYRIVLYRTKWVDYFDHVHFIAPMYSHFKSLVTANDVNTLQSYTIEDYYCSFFNKEVLQQNDIKRRVLFRGMLKPQPDPPNFKTPVVNSTGVFASGEAASVVGTNTTGKEIGNIYLTGSEYPVAGWFNGTSLAEAPNNVQTYSSTSVSQIPMTISRPNFQNNGEIQPHFSVNIADSANMGGFFPIDITVNMNDNIDCEKYVYSFVVEADWSIGQDNAGNFGAALARANFFISLIPHIYYTDD